MGRAFEYRKAAKLKRWGNMARTFTRIGKQIAIAVKAGGPDPDSNSHLRAIIANAKRENMPKDNIERAIKNAMGKDQKDYKEVTYIRQKASVWGVDEEYISAAGLDDLECAWCCTQGFLKATPAEAIPVLC